MAAYSVWIHAMVHVPWELPDRAGRDRVKVWFCCVQGDRGSDDHHSAREGEGGLPEGQGFAT